MRIDSNYAYYNGVRFGALCIKNEKKWNKSLIQEMRDNREVQKLVSVYEKRGSDIFAEYNPASDLFSEVVILKDSNGDILSVNSAHSFKYDLFSSSFAIRDFDGNKKEEQKSGLKLKYNNIKTFIKKRFKK